MLIVCVVDVDIWIRDSTGSCSSDQPAFHDDIIDGIIPALPFDASSTEHR
jgi:hypothetical protein